MEQMTDYGGTTNSDIQAWIKMTTVRKVDSYDLMMVIRWLIKSFNTEPDHRKLNSDVLITMLLGFFTSNKIQQASHDPAKNI